MPHVLFIDDDAKMRQAYSQILVRRGLEVIEAANGQTGIEMACIHQPSIILCDINLPDVDGYTILDTLFQRGCLLNSAFYLVTGAQVDIFALQATDGPLAGFLMKPFNIEELIDILKQQLAMT
jgi:CheY-like chemotaxis protein